MTELEGANPISQNPIDFEDRLTDVQTRWLANEKRRRDLADERIRLVWEAVDVGGLSYSATARAMSAAGRLVRKSDISKFLACGYPEPN